MQARFWTFYIDGYVRIKLNPGQTLSYSRHWSHEEGWSSEFTSWTHKGDYVAREYGSDGRDCDGRLAHYGSDICRVDQLDAWRGYSDDCAGIMFPDWQECKSEVYDQYARAANY